MYDPWGSQFGIVIDADSNGEVSVPYSDFTLPIQKGCAVYAMGKDNQIGTAGDGKYKNGSATSDDIISW